MKDIWFHLFTLLLGIFATVVMGMMLKLLLAEGHLNPLGWSVLILSSGLVLVLLLHGARWIEPEKKEYLELIRESRWLEESFLLPESARRKATQWADFLLTHGIDADGSKSSLAVVTQFLQGSCAQTLADPELLAQAAAYYGEILVECLDGEWEVSRKAGYKDAVVRVGAGRGRHEISPGFLVFLVSRDDMVPLEEILDHELREMSP